MTINHNIFPFSTLDIRKSGGSVGKSQIFHTNLHSETYGIQCSSGYRLFGYKKLPRSNELFFIECRNFSNSKRGLLGAMLVDNISVGKVNANLILTDGLLYDSDANEYLISYYQLKKGLNFHEVLNNIKNTDMKNEFFEPKIYTAMSSKNIIYLNTLPKVLQNYKHPIESSTISPDQWFFWNNNTSDYLKLSSIIREKKINNIQNIERKKNSFLISYSITKKTSLKFIYPHQPLHPTKKQLCYIENFMSSLMKLHQILFPLFFYLKHNFKTYILYSKRKEK